MYNMDEIDSASHSHKNTFTASSNWSTSDRVHPALPPRPRLLLRNGDPDTALDGDSRRTLVRDSRLCGLLARLLCAGLELLHDDTVRGMSSSSAGGAGRLVSCVTWAAGAALLAASSVCPGVGTGGSADRGGGCLGDSWASGSVGREGTGLGDSSGSVGREGAGSGTTTSRAASSGMEGVCNLAGVLGSCPDGMPFREAGVGTAAGLGANGSET